MENRTYEGLVVAKKPEINMAKFLTGETVDSITAVINKTVPTSRSSVHRFLTGAPTQLSRAKAIAEILGKPVTELYQHINGDPLVNIDG